MKEYKQILDELRIQVNMLGVVISGDNEDFDIRSEKAIVVARMRFLVDIREPSMFQLSYETQFSKSLFIKHRKDRTLPLTLHNLKRVCKCMLIIATRIAKEKT